jgi:glycosyltransferase involved in cell wall biosynthesis
MKVSVLITTYNHEAYITNAIESALAQHTNFEYEIIIGEDHSTDRTREIVQDFNEKHSDKIRVLFSDPADSERDRAFGPPGKTNFVGGVQACTGQYIALLDGDDYWTDVHKLQKQVDFLDTNPEFAIACHNVTMFYEDGSAEPANLLPPGHPKISTIEDLIFGNYISTCSLMFRRSLFPKLPDWFYTVDIGDWALHLMMPSMARFAISPNRWQRTESTRVVYGPASRP